MKLKNKVAVVTGAALGIGRAIAILYAREGARVVATDINKEALDEVVKEIERDGGTVKGVAADVSKEEDVNNALNTAVNEFGSLDILVNNAGIMDNFMGLSNLTNELWDRIIAVNLTGPMMTSRLALKIMTGQKGGGVIINVSSVGGLHGARGGAAYVTSKHGLNGLTKHIAAIYAKKGIRCNAIAPGGIYTNIGNTIDNPDTETMEIALKGAGEVVMGQPEEIASVALFLASDEASFVNGAIIVADGGWTAF